MISGFIALLLSVAWLAASAYFLDRYAGLQNLMAFSPFEQAMILAGLSAPLCLLWILTTWIGNSLKLRALRRELRALRALVVRVAPPSAFEGDWRRARPMPSAAPATPGATGAQSPDPSPDDRRKVMESSKGGATVVQAHSEGAEAAAAAPAPAAQVPKVAAEAPKSAPDPAKEPARSMAKPPWSAPPKAQAAASGASVLDQMEALVGATRRDLSALANDLVFCLRSEQDHASALSAYNGGQKDALFAMLWEHLRRNSRYRVTLALQESGATDLVMTYRQKFEDLAKEVQGRDSSGQALQSLRKQPMGLVYDALRERLG